MTRRSPATTCSGLLLAFLVMAVGLVMPASAQEGPSTTDPTTTTGPVTSTTTGPSDPPDETTTTTLPPLPDLSTFEEELLPDAIDAVGENYADQLPFDPLSTQVAMAELQRAQLELDEVRESYLEAAGSLRALRVSRVDLDLQVAMLEGDERAALVAARRARRSFERHAVDAYIRGVDPGLSAVLGAEDANDAQRGIILMGAVLESDDATVRTYLERRAALDEEATELLDRVTSLDDEVTRMTKVATRQKSVLQEAHVAVEVWQAGSRIMAEGFRFPVFGPNAFGDSWGAPRMVGTAWQHWHEGTDIVAADGTPLVAVERGQILKVHSHELGGLGITMRGASGLEYYYAHLSDYAEGIEAGTIVSPGEVIGYVGSTGNAQGGTPHLHFEIADLGRAVNPYPILAVVWAHQGAAILAATG